MNHYKGWDKFHRIISIRLKDRFMELQTQKIVASMKYIASINQKSMPKVKTMEKKPSAIEAIWALVVSQSDIFFQSKNISVKRN